MNAKELSALLERLATPELKIERVDDEMFVVKSPNGRDRIYVHTFDLSDRTEDR